MTAILTPRRRSRRPPPAPTNVLVLVLPSLLFSPDLLPLFHAHFASYGTLHAWTPLENFGRVICVYDDDDVARRARDEMDGFVWEEDGDEGLPDGHVPTPIRAYYGPSFPTERLAYLQQSQTTPATHLEVPSSGKNFLISPPGSPPVGWEQVEEDQPNRRVWHEGEEPPSRGGEVDFEELKKAGAGKDEHWADELTRALRFLSVDSGGAEDDADDDEVLGDATPPSDPDQDGTSSTKLVLHPAPIPSFSVSSPLSAPAVRPAVTISSPPASSIPSASPCDFPSPTATPPSGATKISLVKAMIESMLGRKRSSGDLRGNQAGSNGFGDAGGGGARITPTARPPLA
ncbi:hypothetical protein Rt10032_c08g3431 [Rhodotorula toruloides]|uniref:Uncharacterized protein n=1 Tax=Rhodotorula toruloides TaxID=5286 RepID=A0A511KIY8_RHOTO|nr:hypothetical protein Rt10032_c08g3431 [Rhodotorula toruloides]